MKEKKGKFYAAAGGGVFDAWEDCRTALSGGAGGKFKSFNSRAEAEAFAAGRDIYRERVERDASEGYVSVYTDGSFDKTSERYSYGLVIFDKNLNEINLSGAGNNPDFVPAANVAGEIYGVLSALQWAEKNDVKKIKIYYDYAGIECWASGAWAAKTPVSQYYALRFRSRYKDNMTVVFEKVAGHSNNMYNDKADKLAKAALKG